MKFNVKEVKKIKSCLDIDDYKTLKRILNGKISTYKKKERKTKISLINKKNN